MQAMLDTTGRGAAGGENLRSSLGDDLADRVRRLILTGEIAPGSRLLPKDLQERFDVSVIPVREALRTLEAEGLVRTIPRRGTIAADLSVAELHEVYMLRRAIEPMLAEVAAATRTESDVQVSKARLDALEAVDGIETARWLTRHREFHWGVLEIAATAEVSVRTVRQLWAVSERYVYLAVRAYRTDRPADEGHRAILDCLAQADGSRMRTVWEEHLRLVEDEISSKLKLN